MNIRLIATCLLVAAPLSAPAAAKSPDQTMAATRADAAIRSHEAIAQIAPNDGGAYIELAYAYLSAGRTGDAMNAYHRALALDNVMLETRTGDAIWSHQVARHALAAEPKLSLR